MPDQEVAEITPINATQEKTYEGDEERQGARLAIDKDLATGAGIGTKQKNGGWWKADFEILATFTSYTRLSYTTDSSTIGSPPNPAFVPKV